MFKQVYIPRTLQELSMDEIEKQSSQKQAILFDKLTGLTMESPADSNEQQPIEENGSSEEEDDESDHENEGEGEGEEGEKKKKESVSLKGMTKEEKKEHKKKVKEEKREHRKTKIPKYVKKRAERKNKH